MFLPVVDWGRFLESPKKCFVATESVRSIGNLQLPQLFALIGLMNIKYITFIIFQNVIYLGI